jgi:hypothetical protein
MIAQGAIAGTVLGLLLVVAVGETRTQPAQVVEETQWRVSSPREQWAVDLLKAVGNTEPSEGIVAEVVAWSLAEDSCEHNCTENGAPRLSALERNNLWNTTKPGFNENGCNMADCVRHYATMEDGIAANAATLEQGNFAEVKTALLANDPVAFRQALWRSDWAASHYGGGVGWPTVSLPNNLARATGPAYLLQGDVGTNVRAALEANGGALQSFRIEPGATWSFGQSIAPISAMGRLATVAGVYAGGWCDLSAEYLKVAQQLALEVHYIQHIGVSPPFPSIWLNEWGEGESGQDLLITNTARAPVAFRAYAEGDTLIIEGGFIK